MTSLSIEMVSYVVELSLFPNAIKELSVSHFLVLYLFSFVWCGHYVVMCFPSKTFIFDIRYLISKLYVFYTKYIYILRRQTGTCSSKTKGKDKEFGYIFLVDIWTLKKRDNFAVNRNIIACCSIKIMDRLWRKDIYEHWTKDAHFVHN